VPSLIEELELIRLYGAQVLAITLNGDNMSPAALAAEQRRLAAQLGLPVIAPLFDGVAALLPSVRRYLQQSAGPASGGIAPDPVSRTR
jgi:uncharacterized NAD-dependent epimerase/dehydratase family protein